MAFFVMIRSIIALAALAVGLVLAIAGITLLVVFLLKKKKARGLLIASIVVLAIGIPTTVVSLCSLPLGNPIPPDQDAITIEDTTYQTGFYGDLFPINMVQTGEPHLCDGKKVYHVDYDRFDFLQYSDGTTAYGDRGIDGGIIYCDEAQYQDAEAFYSTPENFVVKCRIGVDKRDERANTVILENFDYSIFEELYAFSQNDRYNPILSQGSNSEAVRIPADFGTLMDGELTIYKESIDGLFTSTQGLHYHIIDGKLYLVIHYVYGNGDKEDELECVQVPDEIGRYVIDAVSPY